MVPRMESNPWHLVESGRFEQALDEYRKLALRNTPQKFAALNNQAIVLLAMGRTVDALRAAEAADSFAQSMKPRGHRGLLPCAQIRWLLGDKAGARGAAVLNLELISSGEIEYATSAGAAADALFVLFVGATLEDEECVNAATTYLTDLLRRLHPTLPNAVLLNCVLREGKLESVIRAWFGISSLQKAVQRSHDEAYYRRALPEVLFHIATGERARGHEKACQDLLKACSEIPNPLIVMEWYLARHAVGLTLPAAS